MNIQQIESMLTGIVNYDLLYETSEPGKFQIEAYGKAEKIITKLDKAGFPDAHGIDDYMDNMPYALVQFNAPILTDWILILALLATDDSLWDTVPSKIHGLPVKMGGCRVKAICNAQRYADLPERPPPQPVNNVEGWTPSARGMGRGEYKRWRISNGLGWGER